ncbi:MAG: ImmA/IrrE family metallo-endopeptidase [Bacteroidales bacterium]|nr:ImmA/IrrE family metallo-endopeptidase [Bacteroidales bacterium]
MRRLSEFDAELLAVRFRNMLHLPQDAPLNVKEVLEQLGILTVFRPLSDGSYGMSIKTKDGLRFMLVSSNSTIGRQHFTIAHELYHLYFDEKPTPHMCGVDGKSPLEQSADMFASNLLLPRVGLLAMLPESYSEIKQLDIATIVKMEQRFQVSRRALLYRLRRLAIINEEQLQTLLSAPIRDVAMRRGYDTSVYEKGNDGLIIGDYKSLATDIFEKGLISEGHYNELLNSLINA